MMPAFFNLLKQEPEAAVRAVLGHFIMNTMLASAGDPSYSQECPGVIHKRAKAHGSCAGEITSTLNA